MMITVNVNKIMEYYVVELVKILRFYILSVNPISCHAGLIIPIVIQSIFEQHSKLCNQIFSYRKEMSKTPVSNEEGFKIAYS